MADPVGTIGKGKSDPALDELTLAYKGGPGFSARLDQLSAAKDDHDKAFAKLQLGKDILALRTAARAELDKATQKGWDAEALVEKARDDGAGIVFRARDEALAIIKAAQAEVDAAKIDLGNRKSYIDQYVADAEKHVADIRKAADADKAQAVEQLKAAQQQAAQHARLASLAEDAKEAADKVKAEFEGKLAKLKAVVADLHGG